jgi:hypothetical protein
MHLVAVCAVLLGGCGIQPWVQPYEREALADPTMSFASEPLSSRYRAHVFETREAARGGTAVSGGGCGCN